MSKLVNIITSEDISNILKYYNDNWMHIVFKFNENYYKGLEIKDVEFLDKNKWLNEVSVEKKMKLFHLTLMTVSVLFFEVYLEKMSIHISGQSLENMFPLYKNIDNIDRIDTTKQRIKVLSFQEIKTTLGEINVDLVSLVSRKNSGTEFTPQSIVEFMFDSINYHGDSLDQRLLEPACGSGIFLNEAVKRLLKDKKLTYECMSKMLLDDKILTGYDINPINVFITRTVMTLEVINHINDLDEYKVVNIFLGLPIFCVNTLKINNDKYDYIIGNPPYIRLQNLPLDERVYIKDNFASATGRFDLYVCFIEKAIEMLKDGGSMSFITSNKYLTANYGKGLRNYIIENFELKYIFDLHDTKYFQASVLPAIITGCKAAEPNNTNFSYFHIKQDNANNKNYKEIDIFRNITSLINNKSHLKEYYKINNGSLDMMVEFVYSNEKLPKKDEKWNFGSKEDMKLKNYIENQDIDLLGEITDICVGIKSTADNVFVKPMTHDFVTDRGLEKEVMYPLIQSHNVSRWRIDWDKREEKDRYILYPHEVKGSKMKAVDLKLFPNVKKYILENENILKSRKYLMDSKTRKWYECWVPQHLDKFMQPKIVTSDIVSSNSFALDLSERICQGNTFFIILKQNIFNLCEYIDNNDYLKYLLGILNSQVMEFYQKSISGSLYSKKYRYTTSNLKRWPIPKLTLENKSLVQKLISIVKEIEDTNEIIIKQEENLNEIVYELYNISPGNKELIKTFIQTNR